MGTDGYVVYSANGACIKVTPEYEVSSLLGKGSYGVVFSGSKGTQPVAIKKITIGHRFSPSQEILKAVVRTVREIRLMRHFEHPNIVRLLDIIRPPSATDITEINIVMDLMDCDLWSIMHPKPKEEDTVVLPPGATLTWSTCNILHSESQAPSLAPMVGRHLLAIDGTSVTNLDTIRSLTTSTTESFSLTFEPVKRVLDPIQVQHIMYQLLRGVAAMHASGTMHRDLKPQNVLADSSCNIKVCDFGLARELDGEPLTCYVETRWYRAPELIMEYKYYDFKVDVWSLGCILAELLHPVNSVLFRGKSSKDQLDLILDRLGVPSEEVVSEVCSEAMTSVKTHILGYQRRNVPDEPPTADPLTADLLQKFSPSKRYTVQQCMQHSYFDTYKEMCEVADDVYPTKQFPPVLSVEDSNIEDEDEKLAAVTAMLVDEIKAFHSSFGR